MISTVLPTPAPPNRPAQLEAKTHVCHSQRVTLFHKGASLATADSSNAINFQPKTIKTKI
jgi:hypothetical protein